MYHIVEARVRAALGEFLQRRGIADIPVVTQRSPNVAMGEVATPIAFELAKRLRRAPRQIAEEIAKELGAQGGGIPGVERVAIAGGGYVNFFFGRAGFFEAAVSGGKQKSEPASGETSSGAPYRGTSSEAPYRGQPKCVVEHTNINPNKAAHIGHLRNAALGDTFVRLLRRAGRRVEVQNYIDNTGVQVADVVVGFQHMEKKSIEDVRALAAAPRFDYFCWDLYARVTQFYEEDKTRLALRGETLAAIEEGHNKVAELAEIISVAIVRCHLRTMERLGVQYDVLPRESEILQLKFWDAAYRQLKERGAIRLAAAGKNAGCWVMNLSVEEGGSGGEGDDDAKVIVRSNGTVTYVGKDIAYQLWKFGLLERDFAYRRFYTYPGGHTAWTSAASGGEAGAPAFGQAADVYNVIDARQAYLQNVVVAGLRALGFEEQAQRSVHFSYEIVALTPRCAAEMGYTLSEEDARKPYVEVSGRKGLGVKADDLLDRLEAAARAEVDTRHAAEPEAERVRMAHAIAVGALRYFLLKFTRTAIIAFDFRDALSFEGETGPYCQYAVVRARNIFRKAAEQEPGLAPGEIEHAGDAAGNAAWLKAGEGDDLWSLVLLAGSLDAQVATALGAQEPAFVAKYAFDLAQAFNVFYHRHHILSEPDAARKAFLLRLSRLAVERQLVAALDLLGIEAPEKM